MRNPFARLAKRDAARPSLRERAAALKASASRVIRRKPVDAALALTAEPVAPEAVAPALAGMVSEWSAMLAHENSEGLAGRDVSADAYGKRVALHRAILAHPVRSVADLAAKAPLFQDELESEAMQENAPPTLPFLAWQCVLRDLSDLTGTRPAFAADPILAAIAETRRLMAARVRAANLPQPVGSIASLPEQEAACDAFNAHVDDVLLKTVPTTAAGCAALARYAVDFLGEEGVALDEDQANEQHVRILDLIARSPMLGSVATDRPLALGLAGTADPVFAALDRYQTARAAWEAYCDQVQAKGDGAFGGFKVTSEEEGRLGRVWSVASTEVLETVPTTEAGRLALAAFVETWVADHGNADGSDTVFAEVYPALLRAVRASARQGAPPIAGNAATIARDFIDSLDLSQVKMRDLAAIHDAAGLICGVADAVGCQPRSYTPDKGAWNTIGLFADAISEACGAVQADAVREARKRTPGDDREQSLRLKILAQATIENGDKGAVLAFARDLQVMG